MKTILDLSSKQESEYKRRFYQHREKDRTGIDHAEMVVRKLGLGGLWKHYFSAVVVIYELAICMPEGG